MKREWLKKVFDWLDRRAKKRTVVPALPKPLSRFLYDLDAHIEHATAGSTWHAWRIVTYFYCTQHEELELDQRVREFIESAEQRYRSAPKQDMAKALGLVRRKAGNPAESSKGMMTPCAREELQQEIKALMKQGHSTHEICNALASGPISLRPYGVGTEVVEKELKRLRKKEKNRSWCDDLKLTSIDGMF